MRERQRVEILRESLAAQSYLLIADDIAAVFGPETHVTGVA